MNLDPAPLYTKGEPLFPLGTLHVTPPAYEKLVEAGQSGSHLFARHGYGDFGELTPEAFERMDDAINAGGELLSCYRLQTGTQIWIRTASDRSHSTLHLREHDEAALKMLRQIT